MVVIVKSLKEVKFPEGRVGLYQLSEGHIDPEPELLYQYESLEEALKKTEDAERKEIESCPEFWDSFDVYKRVKFTKWIRSGECFWYLDNPVVKYDPEDFEYSLSIPVNETGVWEDGYWDFQGIRYLALIDVE